MHWEPEEQSILYEIVERLFKSSLLPAMCGSTSDASVSNEVWNLLGRFSSESRYRIYFAVRDSVKFMHPMTIYMVILLEKLSYLRFFFACFASSSLFFPVFLHEMFRFLVLLLSLLLLAENFVRRVDFYFSCLYLHQKTLLLRRVRRGVGGNGMFMNHRFGYS